ncbi:MAG TPA: hypothetical protein VIZ65_01475 [Cellvibrionaceae bacterium]
MKISKRTRYGLLILTCLLFMGQTFKSMASELMTVTVADQAIHIIRGVSVFKGTVGVVLQKNDIIETTAAGQIELGPDLIMALAPDTKIYLANIQFGEAMPPEIIVLSGWVKVASRRVENGRVVITTPLIRTALENGATVIHALADKTEIFAESSVVSITELGEANETTPEMKVALEQYAFRTAGQGIKIISRPPKEFISNMPMIFRDPLTKAPDRLKGLKTQPIAEREVNYLDVQHWLNSSIAPRKSFVKRFKPRLKDLEFRAQLDAQLGQTADWKPILHPPPPPKPKYKINPL